MKILNNHIKHELDINSLMINILFLLLSIALLILMPKFITDPKSSQYIFLLTIGVTGILIVGFNMLFRNKKWVYRETGSTLIFNELNIKLGTNNINVIDDAVKTQDKETISRLHDNEKNDVIINIVYSKDGQFGAYQIRQYVPYKFEVVNDWSIVDINTVKYLMEISKS